MLLYLMRGTRGELAVALSILGSFVTKWDSQCDDAVIRVMSYLAAYANIVLELRGDSRDMPELLSETFCDSDHGGDKATSRSISGAFAFIMGKFGTRALIAWLAVKMRSSGVSTGEVETAVASVSLRRLTLPLSSLLEFALEDISCILTKLRGDATVAEHVFASGRSKAMRYTYMYKCQGQQHKSTSGQFWNLRIWGINRVHGCLCFPIDMASNLRFHGMYLETEM